MPWTVRAYHLRDDRRPYPSLEPVPGEGPIVVEFDDLPEFDDTDYPCLRVIDPYGHTFTSEYEVQHAMLPELERYSAVRPSPGLTSLIELARRTQLHGHRYLLFNGD
jgi:hypothetical protein